MPGKVRLGRGLRTAVSKYEGGDALKKTKNKMCRLHNAEERLHVLTGTNIFQKSKGSFPAPVLELSGTDPFVRAEMTKQPSAFKSGKFVRRESRMSATTTDRRRLV